MIGSKAVIASPARRHDIALHAVEPAAVGRRSTRRRPTTSPGISRRSSTSRSAPMRWWCIRRCRRIRCRSSSPTPRPIRASSATAPPASAAPRISPPNCSSSKAGIEMVHVPNKGMNPALIDLMGNQVQVLFASVPGLTAEKSQRVRTIAMAEIKRSALMPDLPTMDEFGLPGFAVGNWAGLLGPAGLDAAIERTARRGYRHPGHAGDEGARQDAGRPSDRQHAGGIRQAVAGGRRALGPGCEGRCGNRRNSSVHPIEWRLQLHQNPLTFCQAQPEQVTPKPDA